MKASQLFTKTEKQAKEYDSKNATFLIQAGFVDQLMSGTYTMLPLGLRVINKIEAIVREEMDKIGQEILMPAMSPKQNWEKTDRLGIDVLMKASGANEDSVAQNDGEYILNPTHEDVVTPLVQQFSQSYKDFPIGVYQIQNKFRNEARPKSGLLRGREFRMKDLYSFHQSKEDLMEYYEIAKQLYIRIYERLGIGEETVIALASGGDFTENYSHEFQTFCDIGEDLLFYDEVEDVYYNKEVAQVEAPHPDHLLNQDQKERKDVYGEDVVTVEKLVDFLEVEIEQTVKTLLYKADEDRMLAVAVRGDYEVDEGKLKKAAKAISIELADEKTVQEVTGAEVGYAGLIDLPEQVEIFCDEALEKMVNFEMGINKTHYHAVNLNWGRDLDKPENFYDIKVAQEGDLNPKTAKPYSTHPAAEVGNIFPLETKFSEAFDFTYTDDQGKQNIVYMGSYGIGTTRVMGTIAEIKNDENGLKWPMSIAPYHVYLISIGADKEAETLYEQMQAEGVDVLLDDRDESAGGKFADADLLGIPIRVVVSKKTVKNHNAEIKLREADDPVMIDKDKVVDWVVDRINFELTML